MRLEKLTVRDFRNLGNVELEFDKKVNIFMGRNGRGKTNLLEAIYLLSGGRSFRGSSDAQLIRFGQDGYFLSGCFRQQETNFELRLSCALQGGQLKKKAVRDGKEFKSRRALLGAAPMTVFTPDQLSLIREGPAGRRDYCDGLLCTLFPSYASTLSRYQRIVSQKNQLLRSGRPGDLEIFEAQQASFGASIIKSRAELLSRLLPLAKNSFFDMAGQAEQLSMRYFSTVSDNFESEQELCEAFLERLKRGRQKELAAGVCLWGPHRDDVEIIINRKPARQFASQGQQRSAVLALLLAKTELLRQHTGKTPIVLLDDVMSELDEGRRRYLLERIEDFQVFITCCEDSIFKERGAHRVLLESDGVRPL